MDNKLIPNHFKRAMAQPVEAEAKDKDKEEDETAKAIRNTATG